MLKNLSCLLTALLLLLPPIASLAQEDKRIAVSVGHSGNDSVGEQLAFAVREAIRASQGYRLVQPEDSGIQVRLVTINPGDNPNVSNWTVATVVLTMSNFFPYDEKNPQSWYPIYLTSHVATVGSARTDAQARAILASIDSAIEKYRRDARR